MKKLIVSVSFLWLFLDISIGSAESFISGTVRNEAGEALPGVRVNAIVYEGPFQHLVTFTNENGEFRFENLDVGKYILRTYNRLGYTDEFYDDKYAENEAYVFKIIQNSEFKDVNFILTQNGGHIRGKVAVQGLMTPIEDAKIYFINKQTSMDFFTFSGADGHFKSPALPIGDYFVQAYAAPKGYISEFYNNKHYLEEADPVKVELSHTPYINFELAKGGTIVGNVYAEDNMTPISDAWVVAYTATGKWHADTQTQSDGSYLLKGLQEGQFYVKVSGIDPWSYFTEYYNGVSDMEQATFVNVTSGDTTSGIDFYIERVTTELISNDYIGIAVTDKYDGSNISIANTGGLPDSDEDDQAKLLSDFPYPTMSYTTIWCDGKVLRFGSADGERLQSPQVSEEKKSITRSWRYDPFAFIQKVSLIKSEWSVFHYEDTAKLEYTIVNQDAVEHEVGLRILLDTMLGNTDGVPISVPNHPILFGEQEYFADQIPCWWTAIKCDTTIEGDTVNVSFSAQGTLREYGAICPDRFVIAKYSAIDREEHYWNYQINKNLRITNDSAVALWWYPKLIAPGDTLRIVTFYGLGKGVPDREPPRIIEYLPEKYSTVDPNPLIRFIITDNKTGVDTNSVNIKINDEPALLRFKGKIDSLIVHCTVQQTLRCNQTIRINIDPLKDYGDPPNISEPEAYRFDIIQDKNPPVILEHHPAHDAYSIEPNTNITVILKDTPAGIDVDSLELLVNGSQVISYCDFSVTTDSLICLKYEPPEPFKENETIRVTVKAIDLADPPNRMEFTFQFHTFDRDTIPPYVESISPKDGSITIPRNTRIIIHLKDDIAGVDTTSLKMWVNDSLVKPEMDSTIHHLILIYNTSKKLLFDYEEVVKVKLWATDRVFNAMDTIMSRFTTMEKTYQDTIPPFIAEQHPSDGQRGVARDTAVWFKMRDDFSGVNIESVKMLVNEKTAQLKKIAGDSTDYSFEYRPASKWEYNDSITVKIFGQDLADPANVMNPHVFCFFIKADTTPPYISNINPKPDARNIPLDAGIQFDILDSLAGVNLNSLKLYVDGELNNYDFKGDSSHYTIWYDPSTDFAGNQTVQVQVHASDLASPSNRMKPQSWQFTTISRIDTIPPDTLPPFITDLYPPQNSEDNDPRTHILFDVHDYDTGVDPYSIEVVVNSQTPILHLGSINHRHYHVECEMIDSFIPGQTVTVSITASDLAQPPNHMDTLKYEFKVKNDLQLPDLAVIEVNTIPANNIKINSPFKIRASIQNNRIPINNSFHVKFYIGKQTLKDTVITSMDGNELNALFANAQLPLGTHQLKVRADTENDVLEDSETNNEQEIFIHIKEGNLVVRPNPFTPNNDGFNDEAIFNFSELSLSNPELKFFTFEGFEILTLSGNSEQSFKWDGRDRNGIEMQPGIYLYILQDGRKMVARGSIVLAR